MRDFRQTIAGMDVSEHRRRTLTYSCHRFARLIDGDPCPEAFDRFRTAGRLASLSPRTIESTISDLVYLQRRHGLPVLPGRRLRVPPPSPDVPTAEDVSQVYLAADAATWPGRRPYAAGDWWRALLVVAVWTGLRRGDLARLTWGDIGPETITVRAGKTGRLQRFPVTPLVNRHLARLRPDCDGLKPDCTVFGFPTSSSFRACYDQLARLSLYAGVRPPLTLQALRRLSIQSWSAANAEAGRIVHGCGLGILAHYLDPLALLRAIGPRVKLPEAFLSPAERHEQERERAELIARWDASDQDHRRLILGVARLAR